MVVCGCHVNPNYFVKEGEDEISIMRPLGPGHSEPVLNVHMALGKEPLSHTGGA